MILYLSFSSSSFCSFSWILFWFWKNFWKFWATLASSILIFFTCSLVVMFWSSVMFSRDFFELILRLICSDIEPSSDLSWSVTSLRNANFEIFLFNPSSIYLSFYPSISCFCLNVKLCKFKSFWGTSRPSLFFIRPMLDPSNAEKSFF